jgi:hypothetical protein
MSPAALISLIGISVIFMYIIIQILKFYGVSSDSYGTYVVFYIFLLLSIVILPNTIPQL